MFVIIMQYLTLARTFFTQNLSFTRSAVGRMFREVGLELDRRGSQFTDDIAHLEPLNRHRNIIPISNNKPVLAPSVYISPSTTLVGNVYAGANVSFSFGSVARAEFVPIRIGSNTSIGDFTVLETADTIPSQAFPRSLNIGNNVVIEDNCALISCIVDDNVHIGSRSVIKEGCQLERGCVIAPNSFVPSGSRIPEYTIWAGSPARFVSKMSDEEIRDRRKELDSADKERLRLENSE